MRPVVGAVAYHSPTVNDAIDLDSGLLQPSLCSQIVSSPSFALTVKTFPVSRLLEYPVPREHHIMRFKFNGLSLKVAVGNEVAEIKGWAILRCLGYKDNALLPPGRAGLIKVPAYMMRPSGGAGHRGLANSTAGAALEVEWAGIPEVYRWDVEMLFPSDFPHRLAGYWTELPAPLFRDDLVSPTENSSSFVAVDDTTVSEGGGVAGWWYMDGDSHPVVHPDDEDEDGSDVENSAVQVGRDPYGQLFDIVNLDVLRSLGSVDDYVVAPVSRTLQDDDGSGGDHTL